jgi:MFS family permease
MRFRGPLADSYPAAAVLVVCALVPYLALSSALTPLQPVLLHSLKMSSGTFAMGEGMGNAAYAVGTVLAIQLAVHVPGRRMLVLYAALFVAGSVMAAAATSPGLFIAGHVLQGLCTSLMLIAAVPALVTGWPASKMPITGVIMNVCIFGAVAAGPFLGGVQAGAESFRPLFWIVAGIGAVALVLTVLTFEDQPPQDRGAPWDLVAMALATVGCVAAFFGSARLQVHSLLEPATLAPLAGGALLIVALVVFEYRVRRPLMPVRDFSSTLPVAGIVIAICAGAASVALIDLAGAAAKSATSPSHLGVLFLPEVGGAVLTALIFGALFRTRFTPPFALAGMAALCAGAAVLIGVAHDPLTLVPIGAGLVGLGVGASVSPALFIAGFSLESKILPKVFALVELLRGVAAFMVAPVLLHIAQTTGGSPVAGLKNSVWICLAIAAVGGATAVALLLLGRARLQRPDIDRWQEGKGPAWHSPRLAEALRRDLAAPDRDSAGRSVDGHGADERPVSQSPARLP